MIVRTARDADADAFVDIVGGCWEEYPGLGDIARDARALRALATSPTAWAAEDAGAVVGLIAARTDERQAWEIGRLYVRAGHRGRGIAAALLDAAETEAVRQGARRLRLWTDTRLTRAHAFYEKSSFVREGALRPLDDGGIDFGYRKPLGDAVEVLEVAAAESAVGRLTDILCRCVAGGASISFMAPLASESAGKYWRQAARDVATGAVRLLAAWSGGVLVGTVTVRCDAPENQPHRADIAKLLVHPDARGRGLARALMLAAEDAARAAGRTLLTLDTASAAADHLYRAMGWTEVGVIPRYALNPDGTPCDTTLFWKSLA